jgi:glycosyltransferase involved in cell wall biosynthesis
MYCVNKKILWLADNELENAPGGAQRSDKILIDKGKLLGLNILKLNWQTLKDPKRIFDFDVVISSNLARINHFYPGTVDELSVHPFHVRLEHDANGYLSQEQMIKLFDNCKKTFFLSDYHLKFFKETFGDIFKNTEIVADPIDISKFYNYNNDREDKILYSGYMHKGKGSDLFFEYVLQNPDKEFAVSGWSSDHIYMILCKNIPNIEFLGQVEYENMPKIYNKYNTMFYNPLVKEPFCRSVAEAILCGTKILANEQSHKQIGCLSEIAKFGMEEFKRQCNEAPSIFWSKI